MLNLLRMLAPTESSNVVSPPSDPPLTIPLELWSKLPPAQQAACRSAEQVLDVFDTKRALTLREIAVRFAGPTGNVLAALQVLEGMSLVTIESSASGPLVKLLALPDDHVQFTGPNGRPQWLFVARPLDPPEVEPSALN
jgi:hypothetical protein